MCEHAEKRSPSLHKSPNKKSVEQAQPSVTTPGYLPNESRMSESPYRMGGHKPAGIDRKFTMFEELIPRPLPEDLVIKLMGIIHNAATDPLVIITPDQTAALRKKLIEETMPISKAENPRDLLAILFEEMMRNNIPLEPVFTDRIKHGCKDYVKTLKGNQIEAPKSVNIFLSQWSSLIPSSDFNMKQGSPANYKYDDIEKTSALLCDDSVSTTDTLDAKERRRYAANLVRTQASEPLTEGKLLQILLKLNEIYSPQDKRPYRQGFRSFSAQIGQGDKAIFTTPAIEVEASVKEVIRHITAALNECESQCNNNTISPDDMLKRVITVSAMAYQLLISIHPFADGNGRTCRMFANYILMHYHLLPATFSMDSAKQSMYDDNNRFEENNTEFPQKALEAMIDALETSHGKLYSQPSPQPQASGHQAETP